jgi:hypothetical protein
MPATILMSEDIECQIITYFHNLIILSIIWNLQQLVESNKVPERVKLHPQKRDLI